MYFRSFDLFQFPFRQQETPCLTYSVRVHPRGFLSLSASTNVLSVLLQGLLSKVFLGIKTHYKYKSSLMIFLHIFVVGMQIVIMSDGCKLFILFKICIAITIPWIYPKTKTFLRNFSTLSKALCALLQQPLCKPLFSFVQIVIDFSQLIQTLILYPFAHLLFISIILTHFLFSLKRF